MDKITEQNKPFESEKDRRIANAQKNIPGWGIDADAENDPTYPIKRRNGADYERLDYEKPPQQPIDVEILHSIERPGVSRVFGTVTPPSGVSGILRRYAFKHSESTYAHWVPLVMADRIGVVEGILDDLRKGIFPNIFAEKGWKAEWKYNRKGLIAKLATTVLVTTAVIGWMSLSERKKRFV